jgi:hypothetical protein
MPYRLTKSTRAGTFLLSSESEIYGELTLAGSKSSLYLHDKNYFRTNAAADNYISGVLLDLTRVSLINCVVPPVPSSFRRGSDAQNSEGYHYAEVFPNFVILGDEHLYPNARTISEIEFLIDDADVLFCDPNAFGWLIDARPHIDQIAHSNGVDRPIVIGPNPQIFYFTGKEEIFTASTAIGVVSASHAPAFKPFQTDGGTLRSRVTVAVSFIDPVDFHEAIARASRVIEYLGLIVGRPQNVVRLLLRVDPDRSKPPLEVHWCMHPRRKSSSELLKPQSSDILLNAVVQPEDFARVLESWLAREAEWHNARWRFFNSFSRQRMYDIDRLVGAANMFDILPSSAGPDLVPITNDLKRAQKASRELFRALPLTFERDSILGALGRIGRSSLKHKVRHRAARLVELAGERFPDLLTVVDESVNCRNYYVHGSESSFDYDRNFDAVIFFTDTLEFAFAASDLVDAGWDIRSWILHGTTMSHPFGRYRVSYPMALKYLKDLLRKPGSV